MARGAGYAEPGTRGLFFGSLVLCTFFFCFENPSHDRHGIVTLRTRAGHEWGLVAGHSTQDMASLLVAASMGAKRNDHRKHSVRGNSDCTAQRHCSSIPGHSDSGLAPCQRSL